MNPLDNEEFQIILKDINSEMPLFTKLSAKIPYAFSQGFPKDLRKESLRIDNKFLNNYLSTIEEISYRFPNHPLPKWMKSYQNRYFKANLGRDSFFGKNIDEFDLPKNTRYMFDGNTFIQFPKPIGATLERVNDNADNGNANFLVLTNLPTGTIGQFYDQLALKHGTVGSVGSHWRLGVYNDSGGNPNTLNADTGSISINTDAAGSYIWRSVTEFSLDTAQQYFAQNADSSTNGQYRNGDGTNHDGFRRDKTQTYGAFPSPVSGLTANDNFPSYCKIGHS